MLHKTKGIVLHSIDYSESSLIVKIFTREFGPQSYIVKSSRSKKSKNKPSMFQPLALVQLIVSHSNDNKLQRISELSVLYPYSQIPFDIIKSSIALFLNEILYKSLHEANPDDELFDFIENSLKVLDLKQESCANFHIYFLLQLSSFLGFYPQGTYSSQTNYFNLQEGVFSNKQPIHPYFIQNKTSMLFNEFIEADYQSIHNISLNKTEREELLNTLILYFQLHLNSFKEIKSKEILKQISE